MKENKTTNINLRIKEDEKKILLEKSMKNNMTLTDFLITSALGTKEIKVIYKENYNGN